MHAHVRTLEVDCADQGTTNRINERTNYNEVGKRAEVIIYASPAILVIPKRGRKEHRRYAWGRKEKRARRFTLSYLSLRAQSGDAGSCKLSATLTISTEVSHGFLGEGRSRSCSLRRK